ncbi:MAG: hypothetical protein ACE5FS_04330, partial [Paracoccaceae bacterium]
AWPGRAGSGDRGSSVPSARWTRRAREHLAVVVLRSALGLQLAEEAIHNKLMNPDLGLKFLEDNSYYNFMQLLGFSEFSNLHFVFAAALAEITLAMLLIFGIATRFIVIILTGIFLITFALSGLHDLLGHLPIMAVLLLLLFGAEEGRTRPARAGQLGGTSGAA